MNMYKTCGVVMLPTDTKTDIYLNTSGCIYVYNDEFGNTPNFIGQHLYILSSEEIREGDWVYENNLNQDEHIYPVCKRNDKLCFFRFRNVPIWLDKDSHNARKIIATTDSSLGRYIDGNNPLIGEFIGVNLHQIPQTFINLFLKEYNEGRKIEKVEVEYEESNKKLLIETGAITHVDSARISLYIPKVNSNNTISIKPIKESWNREEVVNIVRKSLNVLIASHHMHREIYNDEISKWLKENL